MVAVDKVNILKEGREKEKRDQLNGQFVDYHESIIKITDKPLSLENLTKKMSEIFNTIRNNDKIQEKLKKGLKANAVLREDADLKKIDRLPLTYPLIRFCIDEDFERKGCLPTNAVV